MGYRGKLREQERARELRAEAWTLQDIADELHVSKSSVSLWVRDVEFQPRTARQRAWQKFVDSGRPRQRRARVQGPRRDSKEAQIAKLRAEGGERIGHLSEREFLILGAALYAGEGFKTDGVVGMANTDPRMHLVFIQWLRRFFDIDESRLRMTVYLHEGLDLDEANAFWSALTGIPVSQFSKPYRATPDPSIRRAKHVYGCPRIYYSCTRTHRAIMGLVDALLSSDAIPG